MNQSRDKAKAIVQINNKRVIVTKWCFPPGAENGWHKHGYDYVVVPQTKGNLLIETKDGENVTKLEAGKSYFRPAGVEHNVVNNNQYEFVFVEIELK